MPCRLENQRGQNRGQAGLCPRSLTSRQSHLLPGLLTLASCSSTPHSAGVSSPSNTTLSEPFSCLASWVRVTPSRRSTSAGEGAGQRGLNTPEGRPSSSWQPPRPSGLLLPALPGTYPSSESRALAVAAHGPKASSLDPLSGVRDMLSASAGQSGLIFSRPPRTPPSPSSSGQAPPTTGISYLSFSLSASGMTAAGVQGSWESQEKRHHPPSPA